MSKLRTKNRWALILLAATTLIVGLFLLPKDAMAAEGDTGTEMVEDIEWRYIENADGTVNVGWGEDNDGIISTSSNAVPNTTPGDITIPSTLDEKIVTGISNYAFFDCPSLTSITIPNSITYISKSAFYNCSSLTAINANPENTNYKSIDGVLFSKDETTLVIYPMGKENAEYTIPTNVTHIGEKAFYGCSALTEIVIPDNIAHIGDGAFGYCSHLISINANPTNNNYKSTNGVLFSKDETALLNYPAGKNNTEYNIPNTVTNIGKWAFYSCSNLINVIISDSVTSIGDWAFDVCTNLETITFGNGINLIGTGAFCGCSALTKIVIPDNITNIGDYAFGNCTSLTSAVIPNSVTHIGDGTATFAQSQLEEWGTPSYATAKNYSAFAGCYLLALFTPENSTAHQYASAHADQFYDIVPAIPYTENVDGIDWQYVVNTDGTVSIGLRTDSDNIMSFINDTSPYLSTHLDLAIRAIPGSTSGNVVIPSTLGGKTVTGILNEAFYGCTNLASITIPTSITNIGIAAFAGCTGLSSITIPNSVASISDATFISCTNLTSITIPDNVVFICNGITILEQMMQEYGGIPEGATPEEIAAAAEQFSPFYNCTNIALSTQEGSVAHSYAVAHPTQFNVENITFLAPTGRLIDVSHGSQMAGVVVPLQLRAAVPTKIAFSIDPNKAVNYTSIPGGSFETSTFDFVNACNSPLSFTVTSITTREGMPAVVANDKFTDAGWQNLSAADTLLNIAFGFVANTPAQWSVQSNMDAWYPLSSLVIGTLNGGVTGEMHLKSKYGMAWTNDAPETIVYDVVYKVDAAV